MKIVRPRYKTSFAISHLAYATSKRLRVIVDQVACVHGRPDIISLNRESVMVLRTVLVGLSLAAGSAAVSAAAYSCIGKVERVSAGPSGDVSASFVFETGAMHWQDVCRLNHDLAGITPAACKGVLAMLTAARLSGQRVEMWFDNPTPGQCNATPWQPLKSMGWYWGPSVLQ